MSEKEHICLVCKNGLREGEQYILVHTFPRIGFESANIIHFNCIEIKLSYHDKKKLEEGTPI